MKKLLLLLLAIFITSCSFDNKNDLEKWGLNGNIKSISISQIINFDEVTSKLVVTYNVDGNYESTSNYNSEGELVSKSKVLRRNNGKKTEIIEYDQNGEVLEKGKFEYYRGKITVNFYGLNDKLTRKSVEELNVDGYNHKSINTFYDHDILKKVTNLTKWNKNKEEVSTNSESEMVDGLNHKSTLLLKCIEFDKFSNCTLYVNAEDETSKFKHEYEYY